MYVLPFFLCPFHLLGGGGGYYLVTRDLGLHKFHDYCYVLLKEPYNVSRKGVGGKRTGLAG